jgi:branched-chain amino acid aminotransferase
MEGLSPTTCSVTMSGDRSSITEHVWLNGRLAPRHSAGPSVASSTFHMGSGVFDGFMAYRNGDHWHLHLARAHLDRFCRGCKRMGMPHDWSPEALEEGARLLLADCPARTHYIRPIAFRAQAEILLAPSRSLSTSVCIFGATAERDDDAALTAHISPVVRVSSDAIPISWKVCGAYANSYIAQTRAQDDGFDTAIFLDRKGRVCEASAANLFFLEDRALVTPRLEGDVFPGLTRNLILRIARTARVETTVRDVFPAELRRFSGAFVCSTLMELRPLKRIDDTPFGTANDPTFRQILTAFRNLAHERDVYPSNLSPPPRLDCSRPGS